MCMNISKSDRFRAMFTYKAKFYTYMIYIYEHVQ